MIPVTLSNEGSSNQAEKPMRRTIPQIGFLTLALALVLAGAVPAVASSSSTDATDKAPTFYKDVLPVIQDNCQVCHRPDGANLGGMVAPMAFTSYADTRPWAKSIARQVDAKTMPPWHASADLHGTFANERTLPDSDIAMLVAWAKAGAPAGDVAVYFLQHIFANPEYKNFQISSTSVIPF